MRDRPSGERLAELAHEWGGESGLVERCHAIAVRERHYGGEAFAACRGALTARYGRGSDAELLARLAAEIRSGAFDGGGRAAEAIASLLRAITEQKLRESNPDYLAAQGRAALLL